MPELAEIKAALDEAEEELAILKASPLYRIAVIAREAWKEPYETYWWQALGDALEAAGMKPDG